jgi:hypothetical protein
MRKLVNNNKKIKNRMVEDLSDDFYSDKENRLINKQESFCALTMTMTENRTEKEKRGYCVRLCPALRKSIHLV